MQGIMFLPWPSFRVLYNNLNKSCIHRHGYVEESVANVVMKLKHPCPAINYAATSYTCPASSAVQPVPIPVQPVPIPVQPSQPV